MISDILDATVKLRHLVGELLDSGEPDPPSSSWLQAVAAIETAAIEYSECLGSETVRVRAIERQRIIIPKGTHSKELRYKVMPFSEVCIHLKVAGIAMPFILTDNKIPIVQLCHWLVFQDEGGEKLCPYSTPITTSEAGLHEEDDGTWYYYPGDVPVFPDVSLPPVMAEYNPAQKVKRWWKPVDCYIQELEGTSDANDANYVVYWPDDRVKFFRPGIEKPESYLIASGTLEECVNFLAYYHAYAPRIKDLDGELPTEETGG